MAIEFFRAYILVIDKFLSELYQKIEIINFIQKHAAPVNFSHFINLRVSITKVFFRHIMFLLGHEYI